MNRTALLGLVFITIQLAACGGDDPETVPSEILPASLYEARCAAPRSGIDPTTGQKFVDTKGSLLDEQLWLRSWIDDLYLWYSEVPVSDPKTFKTAVDYFDVLRTPAITASGKMKDQFHFTYVTTDWVALSQSGTEASYGLQWALLKTSPPRKLLVALVTPGSPADTAGMKRGTEVTTIDGVDVVAGSDVDTLNNGLSPSDVNQTHTFVVRDPGAIDTHTIMMTSANIMLQPVQNAHALAAPNDKVGYLLFTDHIATAEKGLVDAVTALKTQGITDLVLDIRYNGGGYLDIAGELAYMIAGPTPTAGKVFERESFNAKYQTIDPFSGKPLQPSRFITATEGFSLPPGQALPHLDLPRVYVLTGSGTCSASEAVMNGLAGVGVQVIQIGSTTCGKPYGFFPADNCGTTYFAIQFQGVNDKSFGDYADGFTPGGVNPGCVVADDFAHPLGDPTEGLLAAALAYRTNSTCPAAPAVTARDRGAEPTEPMVIPKPLWRQNGIATRHR
jgi:carboxyl-terminal processing protease